MLVVKFVMSFVSAVHAATQFYSPLLYCGNKGIRTWIIRLS